MIIKKDIFPTYIFDLHALYTVASRGDILLRKKLALSSDIKNHH